MKKTNQLYEHNLKIKSLHTTYNKNKVFNLYSNDIAPI